MTNSPKTNISYTNDVFASKFVRFNQTKNKYEIDGSYLLDSLIIQLDNTEELYKLLNNSRIKVSDIAFLTLKNLINLDLKLNYGNCYECSNYQLKKLINQYELNDILSDLIDYIKEEKEENQ